jgi:hypothetical protein
VLTKKPELFFERQFMPTWSLVLVIAVGIVLPAVIMLTKGGSPPLMAFLFIVFLIVFALLATMQTRVREDEIEISFGLLPLIRYRYGMHMLKNYAVRHYSPVSEYGGWGIKGTKQNRALSMRGNEGLQCDMIDKNSKPWKLLIGSQKPNDLALAIDRAKNKTAPN